MSQCLKLARATNMSMDFFMDKTPSQLNYWIESLNEIMKAEE